MHIETLGGAIAAVEIGLHESSAGREQHARALEAIERNEQTVIGVNRFVETEPSPLTTGEDTIMTVAAKSRPSRSRGSMPGAPTRDDKAVAAALEDLRRAAKSGANIMPPSIACAKAGVTTGEWGFALRSAFGEYRAPTGVGSAARNDTTGLDDIRAEVDRVSKKLGRRLKFLVGKPGLDGHSNGAEQIAVRARDAGMDVIYEGIRLDARSDRRGGGGKTRSCRRAVDPVRLAPAAGARRGHAHEGGGPRRRAGRGRRHHPAGRRQRAESRPASPRSTRRRISN